MAGHNITHGQVQSQIKNMGVSPSRGWGWSFGKAVAEYGGGDAPQIAVACDHREASMETIAGVASGLRTANCKVKVLGVVPEDALAYMIGTYMQDGGIYITGGTGPNGNLEFRFKDHDAAPAPIPLMQYTIRNFSNFHYEEDQHPDMEDFLIGIEYHKFLSRVVSEYGQWLKRETPLSVCIDNPISVGGLAFMGTLQQIKAPIPVEALMCNRPSRYARTSETLSELGIKVAETGAALGISFDDDGGGFHAVDNEGEVIHPAHVGALLTASTAARWPNGPVMADHRMAFASLWAAQRSKVPFTTCLPGAACIKMAMRENGATICTSPEGRYYFRDVWWHESGVLAAVLLTHIAYLAPEGLSALLKPMRAGMASEGPEHMAGILNARSVVDKVASRLSDPAMGLYYIATDRGEDGSFILRSCLVGHDWRIVATPEAGSINLCCEAFGGEDTRRLMGKVYEAVKTGITMANVKAGV